MFKLINKIPIRKNKYLLWKARTIKKHKEQNKKGYL